MRSLSTEDQSEFRNVEMSEHENDRLWQVRGVLSDIMSFSEGAEDWFLRWKICWSSVEGSEEILGVCDGYFFKNFSLDIRSSIFLKEDELLTTDNSDDRWVSLDTTDES